MVEGDQVYHYHLNHLGTPRELTNTQGDIVWKVRYRTYGNVALKETEEIENNLRFQGQYFDEESGLHYNRHRYYNPDTGQFTQQDPIGLLGGVNNYQYATNPTQWIDPLGLCKEQAQYDQQPERSPFSKDINGRWHDKNGRFIAQNWPPNDGFAAVKGEVLRQKTTLTPGQKIDRYGG